jgi:hypothetical protein
VLAERDLWYLHRLGLFHQVRETGCVNRGDAIKNKGELFFEAHKDNFSSEKKKVGYLEEQILWAAFLQCPSVG